MNPIETLKYHNKWRRNGEGEMCNPAELGVAIDTVIADYEVMQKENDELRAKVEIMTKLGSDMADELQANYNNQQTRLMSMKWYKEIDSSNSQSLADIRAEAESKGAIKFLSGLTGNVSNLIKDAESSGNKGLLLSVMFMQRMIEEYANRIKEG